MLVTRSLRLTAARYSHPAKYVCPTMATQIRPTTIRYTIPAAVAYSKDTKSGAKNPINPVTSPKEKLYPSPPSPSTTIPPCKPSISSTSITKTTQSVIDKYSTGSLKEAGVKLPKKEEIESFVFRSLVYIWDFTYYVVCLCIRLIKAYVINNPTIQHFWKLLLKRMDDERKKIKSK